MSECFLSVHLLSPPNVFDAFSGRWYCVKCGRHFAGKRQLNRHLRYECDVQPQYTCGICNRQFRHAHHLKRHIFCVHPSDSLSKSKDWLFWIFCFYKMFFYNLCVYILSHVWSWNLRIEGDRCKNGVKSECFWKLSSFLRRVYYFSLVFFSPTDYAACNFRTMALQVWKSLFSQNIIQQPREVRVWRWTCLQMPLLWTSIFKERQHEGPYYSCSCEDDVNLY